MYNISEIKNKREKIMKNIFADFTHCYSVSKTLRFSLLPQGKTLENTEKFGIISEGEEKSKLYKEAKVIFDKCHKAYIEEALGCIYVDWQPLADAFSKYQKDKSDENQKNLESIQKTIKKQISILLKSGESFDQLNPETIIKNLKNKCSGKAFNDSVIKHITDDEADVLRTFDRFSTYFTGYKATRDNVYAEDNATSIAYRLVNDNFSKFYNNIQIFKQLSPELIKKAEEALSGFLCGEKLSDVFSIDNYSNFLSQSGIERYNLILSGKSEEGNVKIQAINEICNEAYQTKEITGKIKFTLLFKQILSERESASFILEDFDSDAELLCAVKEYADALFSDETDSVIRSFEQECQAQEFDFKKVYVDKKQVSELSVLVSESWDYFRIALKEAGFKEQKVYTLADLQGVSNVDILKNFAEELTARLEAVKTAKDNVYHILSFDKIQAIDLIKVFLDSVIRVEQLFKIFNITDDYDKDFNFYGNFDIVYSVLRNNIPLYNKVRNYATKKPYSTEKSKLNFFSPTLANGWDQNKEDSNNAIMLFKGEDYYLGIYNAKSKPKFEEKEAPSEFCYKKMVYKLLQNPYEMLPKVFFSEKGLERFGRSDYILDGYNQGKHKKGENFDIKFCHDLIDYFKEKIAIHPDWKKFGFVFSNTESYKDISEFYKEISQQAYKVTFSYIDEKEIDKAVEDGKMFLFKLYNKDFSEASTGKANLHTLYWKQLFAPENIADSVFKLNGEAELFYRPASLSDEVTHKKGSILARKTYSDKSGIEEELYDVINVKIKGGASIEELKKEYPDVLFRESPHDITKDKRYTRAAFFFHVPITMNYEHEKSGFKMNKSVLNVLDGNEDVRIIGIDRGERNLIYISCIDQNGNIIEQRSLNVVNGVDYLPKLLKSAKSRDEARKNWKSIGKIKELKEGYLSLVVREVADLMLRHNAILVMEDLNSGFKRGRIHFEQQVYQKFEKMLIEKLNYLADKNLSPLELGGISNAYQLTNKFESFQKLGKQSGFLFYVPARWTSKIDPKTGFVSLFTSEQLGYRSVEKSADFFGKFKEISYNAVEDYFEFSFDYRKFDLNVQDHTNLWTACTHGDKRISWSKDNGHIDVNVTDELKALLDEYKIDYNNGSLKEQIVLVKEASFFRKLLWLFKLTVTLRHENNEEDYILSPIKNKEGCFFDSRKASATEPIDGDANGAYHIALQGLRLVSERIMDGKILSDGKNKQTYNWLKFVQEKRYL